MRKRTIGVMACCLAFLAQAGAQNLSVELDGGLQGTQYRLSNGSIKMLPGGSLSILYSYPLPHQLALLTGITGGIYRTRAKLPNDAGFTDDQVDNAGSAFQYDMRVEGYKETQRFFAAGIPVLLQFHSAGTGNQWYVDGGGKILFPSAERIDVSAEQLSLTGFYPDYNVVLSNLPQHGFGTVNNFKSSASIALRPTVALSAAAGYSFILPGGIRMNAGFYIDYGLTGLKNKRDSMPLVTYNPSEVSGAKANGVLNMSDAGRMNLFAIGLQLRITLGPVHTKSAPQPAATSPASSPAVRPDLATSPAVPSGPPPDVSVYQLKILTTPVLFGTLDETSLSDLAKSHLDDVAAIMLQYPSIHISIIGHICNSATTIENAKIGTARAKAIADYLRRKGIDKKRMEIGAAAAPDPLVPDNPGANYQKRRAVIIVQ